MKVTITLKPRMVKDFQKRFSKWTGRKATKTELQEFFENDMAIVYDDGYEDGIDDAIECQFEPADE